MISFIVSTYRAADFTRLEANLAATVDARYEIIPVENPGRYSLTEAYNIGARQARGAFLCFVHEDVVFCDSHWDIAVMDRFTVHADLGLLGVAGSVLRPDLPVGIFLADPSLDRATIRHLNESNTMVEVRCTYPDEECVVRVERSGSDSPSMRTFRGSISMTSISLFGSHSTTESRWLLSSCSSMFRPYQETQPKGIGRDTTPVG